MHEAGHAWDPDMRDAAVLLTSEVVANAVLHGAAPVTLLVHADRGGQVRVEVTDADPRLPRGSLPDTDEMGESGRGLQIVAALATAWGSAAGPDGTGKTTWFELNGLDTSTPVPDQRPSGLA